MSALPLDIRRMAPNPKVARALLDGKWEPMGLREVRTGLRVFSHFRGHWNLILNILSFFNIPSLHHRTFSDAPRRLSALSDDRPPVKILRVQRLHPAGKAVLIFNSALEARQYHAACVGRILGGQSVNSSIVRMLSTFVLSHPSLHAHKEYLNSSPALSSPWGLFPLQLNTTEASEIIRAHRQPGLGIAMDLAHSEAGRVVILRGLPAMLTEGRLHAMLARAYDLAPLNQFRAAQIKGLSSSASPEWNERDEDGHRRTHTRGKMIGPIYKLPEG